MSDSTRYIPILKGRLGEYAALAEIEPQTRSGLVPLIEIVPNNTDDETVVAIRGDLSKAADNLGKYWSPGNLYLDAGYFDLGVDLGDGKGAVFEACTSAQYRSVFATPVLRLDDPALARSDVRLLHEDSARGVCLRLRDEDLDQEPEDLEEQLDRLVADCGVTKSDVDLLLDAGIVDNELAARAFARMCREVINGLSDANSWRSITVAGGAFPVDLSDYEPWKVGHRKRFDAEIWFGVTNRRVARIPDFGDYGVAHPALATSVARFSPPPQLRYATAEHWLILKGRRNDPRGHEQFYDICDQIAHHPEFVGAGLGKTDARIASSRGRGPGNGSTWRQLGTAHHLDLVVRRLTTLGEP